MAAPDTTEPDDSAPAAQLVIRPGGALVYGDIAVGSVADGRLVINLGWARMAGLAVRVLDDPECDRHRGGMVLDRDPAKTA